jgi:hypothetical protein
MLCPYGKKLKEGKSNMSTTREDNAFQEIATMQQELAVLTNFSGLDNIFKHPEIIEIVKDIFYQRLKADECTVQIIETASENAYVDYRTVPVEVAYKWGMMNGIELLLGAMNQGVHHTKLINDSSEIETMTGIDIKDDEMTLRKFRQMFYTMCSKLGVPEVNLPEDEESYNVMFNTVLNELKENKKLPPEDIKNFEILYKDWNRFIMLEEEERKLVITIASYITEGSELYMSSFHDANGINNLITELSAIINGEDND